MNEISPELSQKLLAAVEKMPAFPKSVQRILELTRSANCDPKELVMVIEKDPVMTVKILRILNSAYYSFPKKITSVNQSVVYLGLNTIKNMALSFAAVGVLPPQNNADFDIQRYLMHTLTTASLARLLCQKYGNDDTDPGDCYIAGLLHDFGKVVFAQYLPDEFKAALELAASEHIPLHIAEQRIFGIDHTVAGAMLAERWQFPKELTDTIRVHHDCSDDASVLQCSLFVANQISKKLEMGGAGNPIVEELPAGVAKRYGGGIDHIIASLGDLSKITDEAQVFAQASTEAA
ncbi:MAG: HDOD domain-containing protein [Sideroxydans sp.]|nr:HDOD domain-containing protein [Sideroxydans sp.]